MQKRKITKRKDSPAVEFGRRLKDILREAGIRQAELAEHLGITSSAVSQMLSGKIAPTQKRLDRIMEFVSISPAAAADLSAMISGGAGSDDASRSEFNIRFFKLRCRSGLSLQQLSNRLGIYFTRLRRFEADPYVIPTSEELMLLSDVFGCDPDYLMIGSGITPGSGILHVADGGSCSRLLPLLRLKDLARYAPGMNVRQFGDEHCRDWVVMPVTVPGSNPIVVEAPAENFGIAFPGNCRLMLDEAELGYNFSCWLHVDRDGNFLLCDRRSGAMLGAAAGDKPEEVWKLPVLELVLLPYLRVSGFSETGV